MNTKPTVSAWTRHPVGTPLTTESDQISQNINAVLDFYTREDEKISYWQRVLERISLVIGQPVFLGFILLFVLIWTLGNTVMHVLGLVEFESAPFFGCRASSDWRHC